MKPEIAQCLLALNRTFYTDFGEAFSATRSRIQPGVQRVLDSLDKDERLLDLGCGNGELARTLARDGHHGAYLGLDFSLPLLSDAESVPEGFNASFREVDLTSPNLSVIARSGGAATWQSPVNQGIDTFDIVFSFATMHHIPSLKLRLGILNTIHELLPAGGKFIHSNWQFLNSPRIRRRIQKWSEADLTESDVDENDYLLDWRSGGKGLRYVHHFSEGELANLAKSSGFQIVQSFYSDGKEGNLAIYQVWQR